MASRAEGRKGIGLLLESDAPGGAECMLLQLATVLRERGWDVCPVGPATGCGWLAEEFRRLEFVPETFRLRRPIDWRCVRDLVDLFRHRRIAVAHAHEFTMAIYGTAAARIAGARSVVTMHGGKYATAAWRRRAALRWAIRNSAATVSVSSGVRDDLVAALGLPASRLRVIRNGIRFRPGNGAAVRDELGIRPESLLILSVGNLYPVKGHRYLFGAMKRVSLELPHLDWHLVVAGKVTYQGSEEEKRQTLNTIAESTGLGHRLHLLGHRDDVPDLLAAADVFAMPSLSEGLPLALLEAMFAGAAVVASGVGGIPEVVEDRIHGLLSPPGDEDALAEALIVLARDPGLRRALGERARFRAAAEFTVERMVNAYESLYCPEISGRLRDAEQQAGRAATAGRTP